MGKFKSAIWILEQEAGRFHTPAQLENYRAAIRLLEAAGKMDKGYLDALIKAMNERAAIPSPGDEEGHGKEEPDPFGFNMTPEERAKEEAQLKYAEIERRHEQSLEDAEEKEPK